MKKIFFGALALALTFGVTFHSQAQYRALQGGTVIINSEKIADLGERLGQLGEELGERLGESLGNLSVELGSLGEELAEAIENGDIEGDVYINGVKINGKEYKAKNQQRRFRGSGVIVTEKRPLPSSYHGIKASRGIRVTMVGIEGSTATVMADDNVMPHIKIENVGGVLNIKIDDKLQSLNNVTAEVTLPRNSAIESLEASSAAQINIRCEIKSNELDIEASSAADIAFAKSDNHSCEISINSAASVSGSIKADDLQIEASSAANAKLQVLAKNCEADASSAAKITLTGEAGTLDVEASSAANINAADVRTLVKATADASSGADIKIDAGKALTAKASSGGSVAYKNNHTIDVRIIKSSGGSVRKM